MQLQQQQQALGQGQGGSQSLASSSRASRRNKYANTSSAGSDLLGAAYSYGNVAGPGPGQGAAGSEGATYGYGTPNNYNQGMLPYAGNNKSAPDMGQILPHISAGSAAAATGGTRTSSWISFTILTFWTAFRRRHEVFSNLLFK